MTKTVCDICGVEMQTTSLLKSYKDFNFYISSYGRIWDVCLECRDELNKWINQRKVKK